MPQKDVRSRRDAFGAPEVSTYSRKKIAERAGVSSVIYWRICSLPRLAHTGGLLRSDFTRPAWKHDLLGTTRRKFSITLSAPVLAPKSAKAAGNFNINFTKALGGMTRNVEMIAAGKLMNEGRIFR